jgi:DNA-directed RNA polymerase subunit M/transcription elongation factor TFIIS
MEDETYTETVETMYGHCPQCNRDFSLWLMGVFADDDSEPIETFVECSDCGYRED